MRTIMIYKDDSEHGQAVREFLRDFRVQTGRELETIDPETREGIGFCQTYDIVEYPSIIALDDTGALQQLWRGNPLPRISEVSYYAAQT